MRCVLVMALMFTIPIAGCVSHGSAAHLEAVRQEAARNEPPAGADPLGAERRPAPGYWDEHAPLKYTVIALGVTAAVVLVAAAALAVGAAEAKARSQWS